MNFQTKKEKEKGNAILEITYRMNMELYHTVESFEELGLINPFDRKKSLDVADVMLRIYDFYVDVYPEAVIESILEAIKEKKNV
jgi:hypothetical protein